MSRKYSFGFCIVLALAVGFGAGLEVSRRAVAEEAKPGKIYEFRRITASPGRLPDLIKHSRERIKGFPSKFGTTVVGCWVPAGGPEAENTLVYILAHESVEAAKKTWDAIVTDPEYIRAMNRLNVGSSLTQEVESEFMKATDYSPLQ